MFTYNHLHTTMFLDNKYKKYYYSIIKNARNSERIKIAGDTNQFHHIIPRSLGGNDDEDNIVLLTYKEHKIAHLLLTKITEGQQKHKMMWAYKFFDKDFYVQPPGWTKESHYKGVNTRKRKGSYKTGKDNVFATDKVKNMVRIRMKENNPMFKEDVKEKYLKNRPHSNHVQTPNGYFYSVRSAARAYNISDHEMKKLINQCTDGSFILLKADDRRVKETQL